ncbi:type II toxin-antitoxin system VapC family toxin [uncultured Friedmanniella sp.]|uniref:type II toxin-antitoxin system VapC family toxin n=1 Tax=uncultured Friedmanniella sp. TaxID=335381 RepID=UPI0035CA193D
MIYLDSSALLKLLVREQESVALRTWLSERSQVPSVSSELAKVEVVRAIRRVDPARVASARGLLAGLELVPLTGAVVEQAGEVGDDRLRSLDAVHLASALAVADGLSAFVAYDHRLSAAAQAAGLDVVTPGR